MQRSAMFHVGIVVPSLPQAQAHLSDLLGLTWGPVVTIPGLPVRLGDGTETEIANTLCYSTEPPYVELIEEVPGSPWECNGYSNLHHIGFFTEDLKASSDGLTRAGCPLQISGRGEGNGPSSFAYHLDETRVRIELVDAQLRDSMAGWLFVPAAPEGPVR